MTNLFKQQSTAPYSFIMSEIEWINVASKSLAYCAQLLQQIQQLKEKFETLQEKVTRLEPLVQQLEKQHGGYDTVHLIGTIVKKSSTLSICILPRIYASLDD